MSRFAPIFIIGKRWFKERKKKKEEKGPNTVHCLSQ